MNYILFYCTILYLLKSKHFVPLFRDYDSKKQSINYKLITTIL